MSEETKEHGKFMLKKNKNTMIIKNIFKHSSNENFTMSNLSKYNKTILGFSIVITILITMSLLFKFILKKKYLPIL